MTMAKDEVWVEVVEVILSLGDTPQRAIEVGDRIMHEYVKRFGVGIRLETESGLFQLDVTHLTHEQRESLMRSLSDDPPPAPSSELPTLDELCRDLVDEPPDADDRIPLDLSDGL